MKPKVGLQLWSIQEECREDFSKALKKVKDFGYEGVEFAGYYGLSAKEIKQLLTDYDLEVAGSHVQYDDLKNHLEETLDFEEAIGNKRIVVPYVNFDTISGWQEFIETMQKISVAVKARGQELYYHNHAHEFSAIANEDMLDYIARGIPDIKLEVDLYWLAYAGKDVLTWVENHKQQVGLFHMKDQQDTPIESTELGLGILPLQSYVEKAQDLNLPWLIVEQEAFQKRTPIEAVKFDAIILHQLIKEVYG